MAKRPKRRPAATVEGREGQLVSLAIDLAEKQLMDGTASSQVLTHYLKLGSTRERLEQNKIAKETDMLVSKAEALESGTKLQELYADALTAMREYGGQVTKEEDAD